MRITIIADELENIEAIVSWLYTDARAAENGDQEAGQILFDLGMQYPE